MLELLKNTYQHKKVFVTGHTGFKGSWLIKILSLLGANIKCYALAPQNEQDLYNLIDGDHICESVIADLREKESIVKAIADFQPEFIFHLAAQPLVRLSYDVPVETFEINAIGTANVLEGVRKLPGNCCVILVTTDKVYYNNEWTYPYRENDRLGGYDPYSASKACTELVIDCYRNSFFNLKKFDQHGKAIAVARAGNVIGGGDWSKDRLIPDIIRALSAGHKIEVRNPDAVRPWQHVLEPLTGYLLLGANLYKNPQKFSQAYNFGPYFNDALSVKEMLKLAIENWKSGEYFVNRPDDQPHEAGLLRLDISKAITELNWHPQLNANKAVSITIDWYKKYNSNPSEIVKFTNDQIVDFLNG
ncbi:CDP-glucose 4,6-dehydratase [Mucilaginibacter sp. KACC 22063]|uniref:CDP-glucose 4,6-dehydratase n=1 Tax=Mucilaginibacter sp. KACC 22063 TaxID=3025666 RepID=UPI002366FA27|nr:CDP-glucose 4,6-dehydratase [Mucilaginibacter sp. KACC 22063]WDF54702.1 CDP-glucose 4,6-dehydratase [Mucilaginibacter sp. KACC 22063]